MLDSQTIKIVEENIGSKILDIACSNILLDISPQAGETKGNNYKWDYIKLKSFCTAKDIIDKIKRQPTEWENIFANSSGKGLISKIYKVFSNSTPKNKQTNNPIKKMVKGPEQTLLQRECADGQQTYEEMLHVINQTQSNAN